MLEPRKDWRQSSSSSPARLAREKWASTQCVDAHFSRAKRAGEDEDDWRQSFLGSSIVERAR